MSEVTNILTAVVNLKRNTSFLLEKVAVSPNPTVDRQPIESSRLEVTIVGATIATTGVVDIAGNVNESFNFTADGIEIGVQNITTISGISLSGIDDGFVDVRAVDKMGQSINQEKTVQDSMAVRFFRYQGSARGQGRIAIKMMKQGQEKVADYGMISEPDSDVEENDLVYVQSGMSGFTLGQVHLSEKLINFAGATHHTESEIVKIH